MKDVTPIGASRSAQLGSKAAAVISSIPNDDIAVEGSRRTSDEVPSDWTSTTRNAPARHRITFIQRRRSQHMSLNEPEWRSLGYFRTTCQLFIANET